MSTHNYHPFLKAFGINGIKALPVLCTKWVRCFVVLIFCLATLQNKAQVPEMPIAEQQLENSTESSNDAETDDDVYQQQLQQYLKHPVNINTASEEDLAELKLLSPLQVKNLVRYRQALGSFLNIYELQAVPGWDVSLIQKIKAFLTVKEEATIVTTFKKARVHDGEHSLLARVSHVVEKARGYSKDTTTSRYAGTPQKILLRYKYQFKNLLQYGVVAEKDAGEQFFKGQQKQGFDFYSAHFFMRNAGAIKAIALGDFTVNMGQGLIQWQGLAFKKSADITALKREAPVLKSYNSAGEILFHRGAGITIQKGRQELTMFASYRHIDANLVADSAGLASQYVSSLQTSGYHRTAAEVADKGAQQQLAFGATLGFRWKQLHIGANAIRYKFRWPLQKNNVPYNLFALQGVHLNNYSIDYSYTFKNMHFFGEAAVSNGLQQAFLGGLLLSAAPAVDISVLYRNIDPGFQSLYSNAFTENAAPSNERGVFMAVSVHPGGPWLLNGYADFYKFPWLAFGKNAPSSGAEFIAQLTYKPGKQVEIYSRLRSESKNSNAVSGGAVITPLATGLRKNWRTHFSYRLNRELEFRSRVELVWYSSEGNRGQGFLGYVEAACKPPLKKWSFVARLQSFETNGYPGRIYAYEPDVLYANSVPAFYDKGLRYLLSGTYDIGKKFTMWIRWAQTIYTDKNSMGSGLDATYSNKKSEIKLQLMYLF